MVKHEISLPPPHYLVFNSSSSLIATSIASTTSSREPSHSPCAKLQEIELKNVCLLTFTFPYLSIRFPVTATRAGLAPGEPGESGESGEPEESGDPGEPDEPATSLRWC